MCLNILAQISWKYILFKKGILETGLFFKYDCVNNMVCLKSWRTTAFLVKSLRNCFILYNASIPQGNH